MKYQTVTSIMNSRGTGTQKVNMSGHEVCCSLLFVYNPPPSNPMN